MKQSVVSKVARTIDAFELDWSVEEAIQEMVSDKDFFFEMSEACRLDEEEQCSILFDDEIGGKYMPYALEECFVSIIDESCKLDKRILRKCMYISNNFDIEDYMDDMFGEMQLAIGDAKCYLEVGDEIEAYNSVCVAYDYLSELMWS